MYNVKNKIQIKVQLKGRPQRDNIISEEDIINLIIDINVLKVEEFILKCCQ